jgi:hypothetical protein
MQEINVILSEFCTTKKFTTVYKCSGLGIISITIPPQVLRDIDVKNHLLQLFFKKNIDLKKSFILLINDIFNFVTIKIKNILISCNLVKLNSGRYKKIIKDIVVFVIIKKDNNNKNLMGPSNKLSWEVVGTPGKVGVTLQNVNYLKKRLNQVTIT